MRDPLGTHGGRVVGAAARPGPRTSSGISRPDSSAILVIDAEVQDRHDPGDDRELDAGAAGPLDQPEVVRGAQHHLGHRELGPGVLLGLQHAATSVVERRRVAVPLGEGRDPDRELVAGRADQRDQLRGVVDAAVGRHPRRARAVGRVAAQRQHVADARLGVASSRIAGQLLAWCARRRSGAPSAAWWSRGRSGSVIAMVRSRVRAAGAVGDRHEGRAQRLELADRAPQRLLAGLVLGREELEGERPSLPTRRRSGTSVAGAAMAPG